MSDAPDIPTLRLSSNLKLLGRHFIDEHGRVVHLRGANVGAASKVPNGASKIHEHAQAEYTGRPFPLSEAAEHWARLKSWGLSFIRINVTWDAIEHAGHGQYDEAYLTYLRELLKSMAEFGLVAYVAIHQDVWSRYCGGSGAPGWTLEAAGFDLSDDGDKLDKTSAAFLDGVRGGRLSGERGLWPTGYQKLACATMNTLFWAGDIFAPQLKVQRAGKSVGIQMYLQDAFIGMYQKLVDAVGDLDTVLGFEIMNEPHPGYIGLPSIREWNYNTDLHLGAYPSPLQGFALGAGHTTSVPYYARSFPYPTRVSKRVTANPTAVSVWSPSSPLAGACVWETAGVWAWSAEKVAPVALQEDYFTKDRAGKNVDFYERCYFPFVRRWAKVVGRKGRKVMAEVVPNEFCPEWPEDARPEGFVYAPHWYDLHALFSKQFGTVTVDVQSLSRGAWLHKALYFGTSVKKNYAKQILTLVVEARRKLGEVPIVFGECGMPIDLNREEAFRTGDWKWQARMMDALISAMEHAFVGFNLWTYNPANRDDIGDNWNAENFSWYSDDNRRKALALAGDKADSDLDAGARLLDVIVRPYPIATAGTPTELSYDARSARLTYRFSSLPQAQPTPTAPHVTEIFLPSRHFQPGQFRYHVSANGRFMFDAARERMFVWFDDGPADVQRGKKMLRRVDVWVPARETKDGWGQADAWMLVVLVIAAAFVANEVRRHLTGQAWVDFNVM
ncbi:endo-1,4-beta-glucanase [Cryptotrichosporon argae]